MNGKMPKDIPEENVERLIGTSGGRSDPDFQDRLAAAVLDEVRRQHAPDRAVRVRRVRWVAALAAAVLLLFALGLWNIWDDVFPRQAPIVRQGNAPSDIAPIASAGRVEKLHGLVSLQNGQSPRHLERTEDVHVGQWVETHSGSEAAIVLADKSRLALRPRSRVQIGGKTNGARLVMQQGVLEAEVAKQAPGDSLTIQTPAANITVLGTRLEVQVVTKPDGRKRTRVSVLSGRVELESAGETVVLLPNMEGVADEGEPPLTRSLTAEVNEIIRLTDQTETLAAKSNARPGQPSIVEYNGDGSATIWSLLAIGNDSGTELTRYTLPFAVSDSVVAAFTADGAELPVAFRESGWEVDLSLVPVPPGGQGAVIVKRGDIQGVFRDQGAGTYEFRLPASGSGVLSLVQFRLPASAQVEQLDPAPIESRQTLARLVVTVAVDGHLADVLY